MRVECRLALGAFSLVLGILPQSAWADPPAINTSPSNIKIKLQPLVNIPSGDSTPQDLTNAGDSSGRLFVATRTGKIDLISGTSVSTFLDMGTGGANLNLYTKVEGGFLGLAFSPNFTAASNVAGSGKFYTFTTEAFNKLGAAADFSQAELFPTTTVGATDQTVIREWSVDPAHPNQALTTSRVLVRINHSQGNHQGGSLKFGPDGDLYFGIGDGGGANDMQAGSTATDGHTDATGNAQDTSLSTIAGSSTLNGNAMGKILRINPYAPATTAGSPDAVSANGNYRIPAGNPFAGSSTQMNEIYAYGLRNPYRFSFDNLPGGNNKLYVGDVGQDNREEVDTITGGGNYGWSFVEGTLPNTNNGGRTLPTGFSSIPPIAEYTHANGGLAIVGGFVYRGAAIPALDGKYVFGDYQGPSGVNIVGRLFYMDPAGGPISEFQYDTSGLGHIPNAGLYSFGEGQNGELYALFDNGEVAQIVPEPASLGCLLLLPLLALRRRQSIPS